MKQIMLLTMLTIAIAANASTQPFDRTRAQMKDTTAPKKDTVEKIIYSFQYIDTVKADVLMYQGDGGVVKWCAPGYILQGGFVTKDKATGKLTWLTKPEIIGALDDRKRPVKPIL